MNKLVFVTGASGFLGTHVLGELGKRGYDIIGFASSHLDLTKEYLDPQFFQNFEDKIDRVSYIIHLAAICGGIGANRKAPAEFFENNVRMSLNVLNYWKNVAPYNQGITPKLVCLGSVCSYPKHCPVPFKEEDIWNGYPEETNAPYGIAKRMMMEQVKTYRQQYNLPGIFLIPVNLYGEWDHFGLENSHVIPALIRKFYEAKLIGQDVVEVWGTGEACREFLYAGDAAKGIVDAMEKYDGGEPVNLGTGKEIKLRELIHLVAKKVDYTGKIEWNTSMPDGQPRRCLDVSKAEKYFGFKASTSLSDGLDKTIEWYITNRENILKRGEI